MPIIIRTLGQKPYSKIFCQMKQFTIDRNAETNDEIWLLEHSPVFTLGQACKKEHLLNPQNIEVVQSDRGGQVTYHGPGQLVLYVLIDLQRLGISIKTLVYALEQAMIDLLGEYSLIGERKIGAPGIYIKDAKIGAIGLRVKKGCSYHGLSFNIHSDLEPFTRINPCGFANLKVTKLYDFLDGAMDNALPNVFEIGQQLVSHLQKMLGYTEIKFKEMV